MPRRFLLWWILGLAGVGLVGVGCNEPGPEIPIVYIVPVREGWLPSDTTIPNSAILHVGDSTRFRILALDSDADTVNLTGLDSLVSWTQTGGDEVVEMSPAGIVTGPTSPWCVAVDTGQAHLMVEMEGAGMSRVWNQAFITVIESSGAP